MTLEDPTRSEVSRSTEAAPEDRAWGRRQASRSVDRPHEALHFLGDPPESHRNAPPTGARPGTLAVPADAAPLQIDCIRYGPEHAEQRRIVDVEDLASVTDVEEGVVWVDIQGFGDGRDLQRIGEIFGIHPLALADVVNVPQRPKAEVYGELTLVITRMAQLSAEGQVDLEQVGLVVGPGWVLSFQERAGDVFDPVRARIHAGGPRIRTHGADYLAYALIDAVIDGYFPVMEAIGGVIDELEEGIMDGANHTTLARIHGTRRLLLNLHRIQWRQRDALGALLRDDEFPVTPPVRVYLRDAHDHAVQILDVIETHRDMVVGLMDLYLSSASHRMNEVMRTLTVVATLFIPLTFVAGIYGMNFQNMPELGWRWGYAGVWGLMIGLAGGLLLWFRRRGWLDGSGDGDTGETSD